MNVASHVCDFTYPVKNTRDKFEYDVGILK